MTLMVLKFIGLKNKKDILSQAKNNIFYYLKKSPQKVIIERMSSSTSYTIYKYCRQSSAKYIWICTDNTLSLRYAFIKKYKRKFQLSNIGLTKYIFFYLSNFAFDLYRNEAMKGVDAAFSQNEIQKQNLIKNFNLSSGTMISGHPNLLNN